MELGHLRSKTDIGKLKSHFARYGAPDHLTTDNGPPYNSEAFRDFAKEFKFEHITLDVQSQMERRRILFVQIRDL